MDKFRILFEQSSDAHLISMGGVITDCNDASIKILNARRKQDILKIHPAQLSPPFQPDGQSSLEKSKKMDATAKRRGFHRFEWVHRTLDGKDFPVQVTLNYVKIDGKDGMIAVWHDLTEIKQKEESLSRANEKMKKDLAAAVVIQKSLLPASSPLVGSLRSAWAFEPCDELGGDILNIFPVDETHAGLYVLDVVGHGLASSYLSVAASHFLSPFSEVSFVRKASANGENAAAKPHQVAEKLNRHFSANPDFVQLFTLLYGVLNVKSREFCYICAGHPPPIVISKDGEARVVSGSGMPIGVDQDFEYSELCLKLRPRDRLYLYSDGLTEIRNKKEDMFGVERLMKTLAGFINDPLSQSVEKAIHEVKKWCKPESPKDDITLLAVEI